MTDNQQLGRQLDPTALWLVTALPLAVVTAGVVGGRDMGPAFISALSLWLLLVPLLVAVGRIALRGLAVYCARWATAGAARRPAAEQAPCGLCCRLSAALSRAFREAA